MRRFCGGAVGLGAALAACGALPHVARANPCPCRDQWTAGRHLYAASPQKDVRIEDEALVFRVQRPTGFIHHIVVEVTADYMLVNGGKARDLVIGFPIGGPNSAEGKISSFQVGGDGVGTRVVLGAPEQMDWVGKALPAECEGDATYAGAAQLYDWFTWKQTLRAGRNRLHVRYLQRWFVTDGEMTFQYVLRTARAWGDGHIGNLHVELRDPYLPSKLRWKATPPPTERRDRGRRLVWSLPDIRPARDLELTTTYIPDPKDPDDG